MDKLTFLENYLYNNYNDRLLVKDAFVLDNGLSDFGLLQLNSEFDNLVLDKDNNIKVGKFILPEDFLEFVEYNKLKGVSERYLLSGYYDFSGSLLYRKKKAGYLVYGMGKGFFIPKSNGYKRGWLKGSYTNTRLNELLRNLYVVKKNSLLSYSVQSRFMDYFLRYTVLDGFRDNSGWHRKLHFLGLSLFEDKHNQKGKKYLNNSLFALKLLQEDILLNSLGFINLQINNLSYKVKLDKFKLLGVYMFLELNILGNELVLVSSKRFSYNKKKLQNFRTPYRFLNVPKFRKHCCVGSRRGLMNDVNRFKNYSVLKIFRRRSGYCRSLVFLRSSLLNYYQSKILFYKMAGNVNFEVLVEKEEFFQEFKSHIKNDLRFKYLVELVSKDVSKSRLVGKFYCYYKYLLYLYKYLLFSNTNCNTINLHKLNIIKSKIKVMESLLGNHLSDKDKEKYKYKDKKKKLSFGGNLVVVN